MKTELVYFPDQSHSWHYRASWTASDGKKYDYVRTGLDYSHLSEKELHIEKALHDINASTEQLRQALALAKELTPSQEK